MLHDTLEDTQTTARELETAFGSEIRRLVEEVTDDKRLSKIERKRLQIERAPLLSEKAKLVKLADKICNLRDVADGPPVGWSRARRQAYYDWARQVIDGVRGVHGQLEAVFDETFRGRP